MKTCKLALFVALAVCAPCDSATGDPVGPGDILRITFTTPVSQGCVGGACDTLLFNLPFTSNAGTPTRANLFDGSQFLGTFQTDVSCIASGTCAPLVPAFVAAESAYGLNAAVIDFGLILAGTLRGRLDFMVTAPTNFDLTGAASVLVGHATQTGTISSGYFATIVSQQVIPSETPVVPEPASLLLIVTGAGLMAVRTRYRGR